MSKQTTAERILEAGRELFNVRGFAATSLNDIAKVVGISKGNLSYHFPTKMALAEKLRDDTRLAASERRANLVPGDVAQDYVDHLLFAMDLTWNSRFLLRDSAEFSDDFRGEDTELMADFDELYHLLQRIKQAEMFRAGEAEDLKTLCRSIWIVSRYWMDYLREVEGKKEITWAEQSEGIKHHFAVLLPCLKQKARQKFEIALEQMAD